MSQATPTTLAVSATDGRAAIAVAVPGPRSFVAHARLMAAVTFVSRILGMVREAVVANFFGAGPIWSAFTFAFTVPNLFRKLLGEGALSAAFIPLYAQAVKRERSREQGADATRGGREHATAADFAAASVNLQCAILIGLTVVGELLLLAIHMLPLREDWQLALKLTAIMLPYVLLVCGTAFLSGILQVHERFGITAATSIVLNACLIVAIFAASRWYDLKTTAGQERGVNALAWTVLIAGVLQILMLAPSLRAVGFRPRLSLRIWTPAVARMIRLTGPVALGAGVLQVSTLLDRALSFFLAAGAGQTQVVLLGHVFHYPLAAGAAARLYWAQYLYQFPLGVFAIALATAIFPRLSSDALGGSARLRGGTRNVPSEFAAVLRQGVESSMFIGLPASIGMVLVATPAVRLIFQRGSFTATDTALTALSTAIYSSAIWAFSLQQIVNRAYFALHDTMTPLIWGSANLLINTIIELPLLWSPLHESGMAVGTLVSFAVQSLVMLWLLDRRTGGLGLRELARPLAKMLIACCTMTAACLVVRRLPIYPAGPMAQAAAQLAVIMCVGGGVYFLTCAMLGMDVTRELRRRRPKNPTPD